MIRSFWEKISLTTEKYLHLKIYYPASDISTSQWGMFPVKPCIEGYPVVILLNGFNCEALSYYWLAIKLAQQNLVVITYNSIEKDFSGIGAITPEVDFSRLSPENYGKQPPAIALEQIIPFLDKLNEKGILAGNIDTKKIILGGHSAGGRLALESGSTQFFPHIKGIFTYASHTLLESKNPEEKGLIIPLLTDVPCLMIGGTNDGVIAHRAEAYGLEKNDNLTALKRTFYEALKPNKNSYLTFIKGANHFCFTFPHDETIGSNNLDFDCTESDEKIRDLMAEIITLFIDILLTNNQEKIKYLKQLLTKNELISESYFNPLTTSV